MTKRLYPHTDRNDIIDADRKRSRARAKLKRDAAMARTELSPAHQVKRLKTQVKDRLNDGTDAAVKTVRRAAPLIGLASLGALLFAGRRPISKWISRLRTGRKT